MPTACRVRCFGRPVAGATARTCRGGRGGSGWDGELPACGDGERAAGKAEFAAGAFEATAAHIRHDGLAVGEGAMKGAHGDVQRPGDGGRGQGRQPGPVQVDGGGTG